MNNKKTKTAKKTVDLFTRVPVLGHFSYKKYAEKLISQAEKGNEWLNVTVTAHTGCMKTEENTLESITEGIKYAEIVEIDLNFLPDGTPVLAHNQPKGDEITFREAAKYVASLKDIRVNVDIKSTANLKEIVKIAKEENILDRIFLTGVKDEFVEAVKRDTPEVEHYLNVDVDKKKNKDEKYIQSLIEKVKESGAIGINFNKGGASSELVNAFQNSGLLVSIWTVNKKREMYKILSYHPDNITTRKPDKLKHEIEMLKHAG